MLYILRCVICILVSIYPQKHFMRTASAFPQINPFYLSFCNLDEKYRTNGRKSRLSRFGYNLDFSNVFFSYFQALTLLDPFSNIEGELFYPYLIYPNHKHEYKKTNVTKHQTSLSSHNPKYFQSRPQVIYLLGTILTCIFQPVLNIIKYI